MSTKKQERFKSEKTKESQLLPFAENYQYKYDNNGNRISLGKDSKGKPIWDTYSSPKQATLIWRKIIQPWLENNPGKKLGLIYSANDKQAKVCHEDPTNLDDIINAIGGAGQAPIFHELAKIMKHEGKGRVSILPIATSIDGGDNIPGNTVTADHIHRDLLAIATFKAQGGDISGLADTYGGGISIGGGESKGWNQTGSDKKTGRRYEEIDGKSQGDYVREGITYIKNASPEKLQSYITELENKLPKEKATQKKTQLSYPDSSMNLSASNLPKTPPKKVVSPAEPPPKTSSPLATDGQPHVTKGNKWSFFAENEVMTDKNTQKEEWMNHVKQFYQKEQLFELDSIEQIVVGAVKTKLEQNIILKDSKGNTIFDHLITPSASMSQHPTKEQQDIAELMVHASVKSRITDLSETKHGEARFKITMVPNIPKVVGKGTLSGLTKQHDTHAIKIQFNNPKEAEKFAHHLLEEGFHSITKGAGHPKTVQKGCIYITAEELGKMAKTSQLVNQSNSGTAAYSIMKAHALELQKQQSMTEEKMIGNNNNKDDSSKSITLHFGKK